MGAQSHSYRTYATPGELVTQYLAYLADVKARVQDPSYALNGAIYTEARPPYGAGTPVHPQYVTLHQGLPSCKQLLKSLHV